MAPHTFLLTLCLWIGTMNGCMLCCIDAYPRPTPLSSQSCFDVRCLQQAAHGVHPCEATIISGLQRVQLSFALTVVDRRRLGVAAAMATAAVARRARKSAVGMGELSVWEGGLGLVRQGEDLLAWPQGRQHASNLSMLTRLGFAGAAVAAVYRLSRYHSIAAGFAGCYRSASGRRL